MVKVISLKLTAKEESIVSNLNKEGITNSDLLRTALWHYFKTADQYKKPTNKQLVNHGINSLLRSSLVNTMVNLSKNDEIKLKKKEAEAILIYDYINYLKNEIEQLQEQNNKTKKQSSKDISNLHEIEYSKQINKNLNNQFPIFKNMKYNSNIHYEIDNFLKKRKKINILNEEKTF